MDRSRLPPPVSSPRETRHECDRCGTPIDEHHGKIVCPRCGFIRDCSDP